MTKPAASARCECGRKRSDHDELGRYGEVIGGVWEQLCDFYAPASPAPPDGVSGGELANCLYCKHPESWHRIGTGSEGECTKCFCPTMRWPANFDRRPAADDPARADVNKARNAYISTIPYNERFDARIEGFDAGWQAHARERQTDRWRVIETDGLPEKNGKYWVTVKHEVSGYFKGLLYRRNGKWLNEVGSPVTSEIVAYMPYFEPQPYQQQPGQREEVKGNK